MEKLNIHRRLFATFGIAIGALTMGACNPFADAKTTNTHSIKQGSRLEHEILQNYPEAVDINITHSDDNPNYAAWRVGELTCTAFASQTGNKSSTPGTLL
jgi:hypothetical protein